MGLKLSIGSPVVTMAPGAHGEWEISASIDDAGPDCRDR